MKGRRLRSTWPGWGRADLTDYSHTQLDRTGELSRWAGVLPGLLERGIDVYGYFNNHYAGHSPRPRARSSSWWG
jgi:uncharacterized protein YecE (DUF72 family)